MGDSRIGQDEQNQQNSNIPKLIGDSAARPVEQSQRETVHSVNPVNSIDELVQCVIGVAFKVYKTLGFGFLESVYENAFAIELANLGMTFETQYPIQVLYNGQGVGEFKADIFIDGRLILELKSVADLAVVHEVQLVNYLAATGVEDGLLLNFGPRKVEIRRKFRTFRKGTGQD